MPRFIYDPAPTHLSHALHVDGKRVQVGVPFDLEIDPADDPKLAAHMKRVPGRTVAGEVLPCIVQVADRNTALRLAAVGSAEADLRKAVDALAATVGLAAGAAAHEVVGAVKARLKAKPLAPAISEAVRTVRSTARTLDPNIRDTQPGETTGPMGDGVRAITPSNPPVGEAVVDVGEPRRQYDVVDLPDTNAGLEKIAADNGVELKRDDKRSRETRIEALRRAGLVAEA